METNRILLRPFKNEDIKDVYEYLSQLKVHCFLDMKVEDMSEVSMVERVNHPENYFAIVLKEENKVIGEIFAFSGEGGLEYLNAYSPCWMMNEKYQGKGYMYEAASLFFDYLFNDKHARRIYAYTEDDNIASQKLCEKLGMRQEGLFKEFVSFVSDEHGQPIYENTYQYAILKKEWKRPF